MSAIEETLSRISLMSGVEGYVIVDSKGTILRQSKSLSPAEAAEYAHEMLRLSAKARHVVRDLDPKNDLEVFRLRAREREILVAPGPSFLVVVIQKWTPSHNDEFSALQHAHAVGSAPAGSGAAVVAAGGAPKV